MHSGALPRTVRDGDHLGAWKTRVGGLEGRLPTIPEEVPGGFGGDAAAELPDYKVHKGLGDTISDGFKWVGHKFKNVWNKIFHPEVSSPECNPYLQHGAGNDARLRHLLIHTLRCSRQACQRTSKLCSRASNEQGLGLNF